MSPFELATGLLTSYSPRSAKAAYWKEMSCSIQIRPFKERNAGRGTRQLACLDKAIGRMNKYADKGRRPMVGDKVMLKLTPQILNKISSKTVHRGLIPKYDYDGPFEVFKRVGNVAYRLKLPEIREEKGRLRA